MPTPLADACWPRARSTSWSSARAPRGPTPATAAAIRVGTPHEVATEVSLNTAYGVERVVRDAFARAAARPRRRLTLVHKTNVLVHAGAVWSRVVREVGEEFPDVEVDYLHVDAATIFLATDPARFDVIVTDNLFGDIITDLAAAITGGIGLAASGNINPDRTAPSMFEPVHGSAPDIAGQQKADPTAAILSAGLLLDHLGHAEAAARVEAAVVADLAASTGAPGVPRHASAPCCGRLAPRRGCGRWTWPAACSCVAPWPGRGRPTTRTTCRSRWCS